MKFSYNFLQSFFKSKLPSPEKLADLLMMRFFEVEDLKKMGKDTVLDIDILSSRAGDCFSHIGIAREISAITGLKYELPKMSKKKESSKALCDEVSIDVRDGCRRYLLAGVEGVRIKKSPLYIQKRLKSCGIKPINNIVDITNYVMLETGQPLHAFDADKLQGDTISVRYAKKREKIVTLDEKRIELDEDILVIADNQSSIGIAGIKGGVVAEIDKGTNRVYLEAANFDPVTIRKGSRRLALRTDASLRFEHGMSAKLAEVALNRAICLINSIAGGRVLSGSIDYYKEKEEIKKIDFDAQDARDLLGVDIPLKEIEKILRGLEFRFKRKDSLFFIEVPFFRVDIETKEDIIEEIGRIYGYDNIEAIEPKDSIIPVLENREVVAEKKCRDIWQGFGFTETYNYSFINNSESSLFNKHSLIEVEKPVSLEFKYLRPSLFPGLLKNVKENEKNFSKINFFEIGKIFFNDVDSHNMREKKMLSIASSADNFYQIKGKIDLFLKELLLEEPVYANSKKSDNIIGSPAVDILVNGEKIGTFGPILKEIKKKKKIECDVVVANFDFEKLIKFYKEVKEYKQISRFPAVIRDISIVVPEEIQYIEVEKKIKSGGGKTLEEINLFDLYRGKEIGEGKKNFTFRLYFRDEKGTLSGEAVNKLQDKIISTLEEYPEWKVRKK